MISKQTAERVWSAYREIEAGEKLLSDMAEVRDAERVRNKHAPTLSNVFGERKHLELGIPSGENGHRIFRVAPQLAESVIRAHIANQQAELAEANEQAKIECDEAGR